MEEFKPKDTKTPAVPYSPQKNDILPIIQIMEEKINLILRYQKRAAHMETARTIMSILIFIIFVVLPIIVTFYLYVQFKDQINFGKIASQYQDLSGAIDEFKSTSDQIGQIKNSITTDGIKNLLNGGTK
jgi:hypothetical protein